MAGAGAGAGTVVGYGYRANECARGGMKTHSRFELVPDP